MTLRIFAPNYAGASWIWVATWHGVSAWGWGKTREEALEARGDSVFELYRQVTTGQGRAKA